MPHSSSNTVIMEMQYSFTCKYYNRSTEIDTDFPSTGAQYLDVTAQGMLQESFNLTEGRTLNSP